MAPPRYSPPSLGVLKEPVAPSDSGRFQIVVMRDATGFAEADWSDGPDRHLVQYLRPLGDGAVLYNTLGHCRGHWDMAPVADYYPRIERCSWELPVYYELLRRGLRWCLGELGA